MQLFSIPLKYANCCKILLPFLLNCFIITINSTYITENKGETKGMIINLLQANKCLRGFTFQFSNLQLWKKNQSQNSALMSQQKWRDRHICYRQLVTMPAICTGDIIERTNCQTDKYFIFYMNIFSILVTNDKIMTRFLRNMNVP